MILDIEGDSLTPTKIYCLAYYDEVTGEEDVLTDYEDMRRLLRDKNRLIGHNIIRFDIPVLERILGIDLSNKEKIDTLGLSWYLYNDRTKHGLEVWGNELGIKKPEIKDWQNLSIEEYKFRCKEDVRINTLLYFKEMEYLNKLYNNKTKSILNYIAFKLDCAREQEEIKWKLDVEKVKSNLAYFESESNRRLDALRQIMPKVTKYKSISKPDKLYKKDGSLTVQATNWFDLLYEQGLEKDHEDPINIIVSEVDGNPKSHTQMKDWLFSLDWIPDYFKKNEKGEDIPQISNAEKQVCNSIKLLYEIEPGLENLESLSVINHRIGVLEGFLENEEDGWVKAEISGFTNTMRFKHSSPCVNLPKAFEESDKRSREYTDGVYIRECLIADEGFQLCGSDMSALEDTTKQHYIFKYDPEYIKEMRTPGYDPHLSLAMLAGMLTEQQVEDHKNGVVSYKNIRFKAKTANFASTYKVGYKKLAFTSGMSELEAKALLKTFWERNNAILKTERDTKVKMIDKDMWLYNPVSRLWYSLRYEKDKFSTLNQGTAEYCFICYVKEIRKRYKICGQFHDEVIIPIEKGKEEELKKYLYECIDRVNKTLKLNVPLGISIDFGNCYASIH